MWMEEPMQTSVDRGIIADKLGPVRTPRAGEYPEQRYGIADAKTGALIPGVGFFDCFGNASLAAMRLWKGKPLHVIALASKTQGQRIARVINRAEVTMPERGTH
jgi:hypothetical protein